MDEDRLFEIKSQLQDVSQCKSLYLLYCEGIDLPDSLQDAAQKLQLQTIIRKLFKCVEYAEQVLLDPMLYVSDSDQQQQQQQQQQHHHHHHHKKHSESSKDSNKPISTNNVVISTPQTTPTTETFQPPQIPVTTTTITSSTNNVNTITPTVIPSLSLLSNTSNNSTAPVITNPFAAALLKQQMRKKKRKSAEVTSDTSSDSSSSNSDNDDDEEDEKSVFTEQPPTRQKSPTTLSIFPSNEAPTTEEKIISPPHKRIKIAGTFSAADARASTASEPNVTMEDVAASSEDDSDDNEMIGNRNNNIFDLQDMEQTTRIVSATEIRQCIFLEMQCYADLEHVLEQYRMMHANALLGKIVYYSLTEKRNKNVCLFDEIFLLLCKCKCVLAKWRSAHSSALYNVRSSEFDFVLRYKLCCEHKHILHYSVKDIVCSLQSLANHWNNIAYCEDLERYIDLLQLRCAMLVSYTSDARAHNMPRYRRVLYVNEMATSVEEKSSTMVCVPNQDFISDMSVYFYCYKKFLARRRLFNVISFYELDFLFNEQHSHHIIARLGSDTSSLKLNVPRQSIQYNTSIYQRSNYTKSSLLKTIESSSTLKKNDLAEKQYQQALLSITGRQQETPNNIVAQRQAMVMHKPKMSGKQVYTLEERLDQEQLRFIYNDAENIEYVKQTYQHQVSFEIRSMDQMRICFFINDEILKFYTKAELSWNIMKWLQMRAETLYVYGEETMRLYRKICLNYCVLIGEDMLFEKRGISKNKTIETVLKNQRGIKVFNKMQESLDKEPNKILPDALSIFDNLDSALPEDKFVTLTNTRNEAKYVEYRRKVMERQRRFTSTATDANTKNNNNTNNNNNNNNKKTYEKKPQSKIYNCWPTWVQERKNCILQRTDLDIYQKLLCIKLIDGYFENYFNSSWEEHFVIFERELEEKYDSYSRKQMPIIVQAFNHFSILYCGDLFEIGNFICTFYVWLRLIDKFHARTVNGTNISLILYEIFQNEKYYRENCDRSLEYIFNNANDEKEHKISEKSQKDEELIQTKNNNNNNTRTDNISQASAATKEERPSAVHEHVEVCL